MFLVGMWHGASWNFVVYANMHAAAMVYNRWNRLRDRKSFGAKRVMAWVLGLSAFGGTLAVLGHYFLKMSWAQSGGLVAVCMGLYFIVTFLPLGGKGWRSAAHIFLTFHYLVLSRIFFRAPDLETSRAYMAGLFQMELGGIRPGLITPWVWAALIFGLAYHFTPKSWVDEKLRSVYDKLPGVLLGLLFAGVALGLMKLLEGSPRAFIYFQF